MKKTNVRMLTQLGMLIALQFVLSKFCSISTDSLRIGFGFVPMVICGMLYGPFWCAAAYAVADILGGVIIQIGDTIYDGSVRTRLETVRRSV